MDIPHNLVHVVDKLQDYIDGLLSKGEAPDMLLFIGQFDDNEYEAYQMDTSSRRAIEASMKQARVLADESDAQFSALISEVEMLEMPQAVSFAPSTYDADVAVDHSRYLMIALETADVTMVGTAPVAFFPNPQAGHILGEFKFRPGQTFDVFAGLIAQPAKIQWH